MVLVVVAARAIGYPSFGQKIARVLCVEEHQGPQNEALSNRQVFGGARVRCRAATSAESNQRRVTVECYVGCVLELSETGRTRKQVARCRVTFNFIATAVPQGDTNQLRADC